MKCLPLISAASWIPKINLYQMLLNATIVLHERIRVRDGFQMQWGHSTLAAYEEFWARKADDAENKKEVLRQGKEAVEALEKEVSNGVGIETEWSWIIMKGRWRYCGGKDLNQRLEMIFSAYWSHVRYIWS